MPPTLPPTVHHEDPFERLSALEELVVTDADQALHVAGHLLADADANVREQAARVLTDAATPEAARLALPYIASSQIRVRNLAGEVLVHIGEASIEPLAESLDDEDKDVRKFAIDVLALLPAASVRDRIAAHLDDPCENVILAAIDALAVHGAGPWRDELHTLFRERPFTRASVVTALGPLNRPDDLDLMAEALEDTDPSVQLAAAEGLRSHLYPDALRLLDTKARTVHPVAQPIVLSCLVEMGEQMPEHIGLMGDDTRDLLLTMLQDLDHEYVRAAIRGLRFYEGSDLLLPQLAIAGTDDATDVELFNTLSGQARPFEMLHVAVEQDLLAPETAIPFMVGLMANGLGTDEAEAHAATFVGTHFQALDADTKMAALSVAAQLDPDLLHPILEAGQQDPDPSIRSVAEDLLA